MRRRGDELAPNLSPVRAELVEALSFSKKREPFDRLRANGGEFS